MYFRILFIFSMISFSTKAQYRNDNLLYKTVYPQDLCKMLEANPGYLLLDVRSPGEYADTSSSRSLNIGHLEGAVNMDIRQIPNRLNEISSYKNKPVFIYCSHSQRSRRVSKMLADSGFTKLFNINGGLTALHMQGPSFSLCAGKLIRSGNAYKIISPEEVCRALQTEPQKIYLLDVRSDSAWTHSLTNARYNSYGYIKGANHIALVDLEGKLQLIPRDKKIVLVDLNGNESPLAAGVLSQKGFKNVFVLIEGMDRFMSTDKKTSGCAVDLYVPASAFRIISAADLYNEPDISGKVSFLDIRSDDEFMNKHTQTFRNMGHVKGAVHFSLMDLQVKPSLFTKDKNTPVIVYDFANGTDAFAAADLLVKNGFTDVRVLAGGLFNLRWTAANIRGMQVLEELVTDIPEQNK